MRKPIPLMKTSRL
jgi:hypothetical protein